MPADYFTHTLLKKSLQNLYIRNISSKLKPIIITYSASNFDVGKFDAQ